MSGVSRATTQVQRSRETRRRVLEAAHRVLADRGVNALTMDSVAKEAGVSKGGLSHHFGTKKSLIDEMLRQTMAELDAGLVADAASDDAPVGRFARAYLRHVEQSPVDRAAARAIFAAAAVGEGDLEIAREQFACWQQRIVEEDGIDPGLATLIRVVGDGLWLIDLFDLAPPSVEMRQHAFELLRELVSQAASPNAGAAVD